MRRAQENMSQIFDYLFKDNLSNSSPELCITMVNLKGPNFAYNFLLPDVRYYDYGVLGNAYYKTFKYSPMGIGLPIF